MLEKIVFERLLLANIEGNRDEQPLFEIILQETFRFKLQTIECESPAAAIASELISFFPP